MNELQERLNELEIRFTHQAMLLEELNDVVAENARRIDLLERDNRQIGRASCRERVLKDV